MVKNISSYHKVQLVIFAVITLLLSPYQTAANQIDSSILAASPVQETHLDSIIAEQQLILADTITSSKVENAITDKNQPTLKEDLLNAPRVKEVISFGKIFWSIVFIAIGYFILRAIGGVLSLLAERKPKYKPLIFRTLPIVKILGWSFIVYIIISGVFQPPRETVFAFFASVGVAIGFAAQDLLKNIFGGLMIMFDKPFQIGDKIESGKYYGEVLEVGLRSTRIVTADDSVVTIPNSEMMNQSISNSNSSENNCQVVAELFLPQTIDTQRVREIATEVAQVSKYIYLNKPITVVFFSELTNNKVYLKMRLKAYVMDIRYEFAFKSEMTELVLLELQKEGLISE
ncbi:MAG: mechanosensitive ion channel family protein [Tenuifilaceae bacterium]|jgi:small-conductance mechanosensitive channel|nr:mechanosensitive ion channel family protein [Tenuifilaceae bacterium]